MIDHNDESVSKAWAPGHSPEERAAKDGSLLAITIRDADAHNIRLRKSGELDNDPVSATAFTDGFLHGRGFRFMPTNPGMKSARVYEPEPARQPIDSFEKITRIVLEALPLQRGTSDKHIIEAVQSLIAERANLAERVRESHRPIPLLLFCPLCHFRHIDEGEFATKPHKDHSCQNTTCGLTWRPATVPTVGVAHLPGYRDDCTCIHCEEAKRV